MGRPGQLSSYLKHRRRKERMSPEELLEFKNSEHARYLVYKCKKCKENTPHLQNTCENDMTKCNRVKNKWYAHLNTQMQ